MSDAVKFFINQPNGCQFCNEKTNRIEQIPGWIEYETIFLKLLNNEIQTNVKIDNHVHILLSNPILSEESLIEIVENMKNIRDANNNIFIKNAITEQIKKTVVDMLLNPNITERFIEKYINGQDRLILQNENCEKFLLKKLPPTSLVISEVENGKLAHFSENFYNNLKRDDKSCCLRECINFSNPKLSLKFYKCNIFPIKKNKSKVRFLQDIYSDNILEYFLDKYSHTVKKEIIEIFHNENISVELIKNIIKRFNIDISQIEDISCRLDVDLFIKMCREGILCMENYLDLVIDPDEKFIKFLLEKRDEYTQDYEETYKRDIDVYILKYYNDPDKILENIDKMIKTDVSEIFFDCDYMDTIINKNLVCHELLKKPINPKVYRRDFLVTRKYSVYGVSTRFLERNINFLLEQGVENLFSNRFCPNKRVANNNFKRMGRNITRATVDSILYRPGNSGFQQNEIDFKKKL